MPEYIVYPIDTDPEDLAQLAYDELESSVPGWEAHEGNFETLLIAALSRIAADLRDVASDVPTSIFRYFGASIMGISPSVGAAAEATTTWTMVDNSGYTIPSGTLVGIPSATGLVAFEVTSDISVPNGSTTATGVTIRAVEIGTEPNGLNTTPQLIDSLTYVSSVALDAAVADGVDPETDDDYLLRLAQELQLMAPRPILPNDFVAIALRDDNVYRAIALDGYDPVGETYDNDKMVTIVPINASGAALTTDQKNNLKAALEAVREVNFVVNVMDPSFSEIDVTTEVTYLPGYEDTAALQAAVEAGLAEALSPLNWNQLVNEPLSSWLTDTKVRYLEVAEILNRIPGVRYVKSLTIGKDGGSQAASDVSLTGAAPLPQPGTFVVTVSAHT